MKRLLIALALLAFGWGCATAEPVFAQERRVGMPMVYEIPPEGANIVVANLVTESLRRDPSGNGYVRGTPCLTPNHLYNAIKRAHPSVAPPSVAELPAFLRTLVLRRARAEGFTGRYTMSRMLCERAETSRPADEVDWGAAREFRLNEYAWFHPNSSAPIMAGDCGNVVLAPIAPPPAEERCVELHFNAFVGGKVRWGVGSLNGALAPSECNAIRQGDGAWKAWGGECDECVPAIGYISQTLGGTAQVPHRYLYDVEERHQTIRFSTEVWEKTVYICLEDANGRRSCGVYTRRQDWHGRYSVEISDSLWILDDGHCPA